VFKITEICLSGYWSNPVFIGMCLSW